MSSVAQYRTPGRTRLALILAASLLGGCTSAGVTPRGALPPANAAGDVTVIFANATVQLSRLAAGIRQVRGVMSPNNPAAPFLQKAVDLLDFQIGNLSPFGRMNFRPTEVTLPGLSNSTTPVYSATFDISQGQRYFATAVVQDNLVDKLNVTLVYDGYVGGPSTIVNGLKGYGGFLLKSGAGGDLQHFTWTSPTQVGPPDNELQWTIPDFSSGATLIVSDQGPLPNNSLPRKATLQFNSDFSGSGTVNQPDGTTGALAWP